MRTYLLRRERVSLGAVPEGNSENYRVSPTKIPFSTGTYRPISAVLTVPVGKDYRISREVHQRFFLQIEANFKRVGVALVCVNALMFLFLFGKRGR